MNNPIEQINNINGKQAFLDFVARLAKDAKEKPEEWANSTVSDYLNLKITLPWTAPWIGIISTIKPLPKFCIWVSFTNN